MTPNKQTVDAYMAAFRITDHAAILDCLTEDVEWIIHGHRHLTGKAAFDGEIENEGFVGSPTITVHRLTEENDVVVAEGTVRCTTKGGVELHLAFCDVFEMQNAKVKKLTSFLAPLNT